MGVLVFTNTGSVTPAVKIRIHDGLVYIADKYGDVDVLICTEIGKHTNDDGITHFHITTIMPWFPENPSINHKSSQNLGIQVTRGIATYARNLIVQKTNEFQNLEVKSEILTTIHNFSVGGGRGRRTDKTIAILACYNNHNLLTTDLEHDIRHHLDKALDMGISEHIIVGDFNDKRFEIAGYRQIGDKRWWHKHRSNANKNNIDKLFTNIDHLVILDVLDSWETSALNDNELGHKVLVFGLEKPANTPRQIINYDKINKFTTDHINELMVPEAEWEIIFIKARKKHDDPEIVKWIEDKSENLVNFTAKIVKLASYTTTQNRQIQTIITEATDNIDENLSDKKVMAKFYQFGRNIKNGVQHSSLPEPKPIEFKLKMESKLQKMVKTDILRTKPQVIKYYQTEFKPQFLNRPEYNPIHIRLKFPNIGEFQSTISTTNESGAKDYTGVPTRATSAMFKRNLKILRFIHKIFKLICFTSFTPRVFRIDNINSLYKRTGDVMDPGNYRPITHAEAWSKHLDKVKVKAHNSVPDKNIWNHAYTSEHSIFSAVIEFQEEIQNIKRLNQTLLTKIEQKTWIIIPVIDAEDVSGAFESMHRPTLVEAVKRMHGLDHLNKELYNLVEIKIDKLTHHYLDREAQITGKNGEIIKLELILERSGPQGSSESPKFWRITHYLFTARYMEWLNKFERETDWVVSTKHICFADDDITIFGIKIRRGDPYRDNREEHVEPFLENVEKIKYLLHINRQMYNEALNFFGCNSNALKTEIVIAEPFTKHIPKSTNNLKWLGNTFELTINHHLLMTDKQLNKRQMECTRFMQDIFSYATDTKTRIRIYKVWVDPVIEFFTLREAFLSKVDGESSDLNLTRFQHKSICLVFNLKTRGADMQLTRNIIYEPELAQKTRRFCRKILEFTRIREATEKMIQLQTAASMNQLQIRNRTVNVNTLYTSKNSILLKIRELSELNEEVDEVAFEMMKMKKTRTEIKNRVKKVKTKQLEIILNTTAYLENNELED